MKQKLMNQKMLGRNKKKVKVNFLLKKKRIKSANLWEDLLEKNTKCINNVRNKGNTTAAAPDIKKIIM